MRNNLVRKSFDTDKAFKAALVGFSLWALFCLSLLGVVIYVAAHFIAKFW